MKIEVYISNISEDVWAFIQTMSSQAKKAEVTENAYLSDRDVFALTPGDRTLFITPSSLDTHFLAYIQKLLPLANLEVINPASHSGQVCKDIQTDTALFSRLVTLGQEHTLLLRSYSSTSDFLELVAKLRSEGATVLTPESPVLEDSWTVNFYGSKGGIRQLTDALAPPDGSWMAEGKISQGIPDVSAIAARVFTQKHGVVLKTNKAHAGAGVVILKKNDLSSHFADCQKQLQSILKKEKYWQEFPTVIEEYLAIDPAVGGGNPNCEYRINHDGSVELLYYCGMRVSSQGVFKGIEIHQDVLEEPILAQLLDYGQRLGEVYSRSGYRGYFDVDCVFTKEGKLLITESNVRRTGGTHVYHAALQLIGSDFMSESYILSNNSYKLPTKKIRSFTDVVKKLQPILFSPDTKEGVVIASANLLHQHSLGYIVFGRTKSRALAIEKDMEQALQ